METKFTPGPWPPRTKEQRLADAAPAMYEALQRAVSALDCGPSCGFCKKDISLDREGQEYGDSVHEDTCLVTQMRAALRKAEGKE